VDLVKASAWQVFSETFKVNRVQTHLYRMTGEMMVFRDEPGTVLALFIILGFSHRYPSDFGEGGSQEFINTLAKCIKHHGGELFNGNEINRIKVRPGCASAAPTAGSDRYVARQALIAGIARLNLDCFIDNLNSVMLADAPPARASDFGIFLSSYALNQPVVPRYPKDLQRIQINQCVSGK